MKRIIALLLAAGLTASLFAACSSEKKGHKIYIRDDFAAENLKVVFSSTTSDKSETVKPDKLDENDDYTTYSVVGDDKKYDRLVIKSDDEESIELAFNNYVSGWELSSYGVVPFTYDEKEKTADYAVKNFKYGDGDKDVYILTPEGYDKNSKKKYPVIYMCDGQNLFDKTATSHGCWGVPESIRSMQKNTGKGVIIVGIDDGTANRDSELTPDIGEVQDVGDGDVDNYKNGTGKYYSDFVVNTVMPYVEKNYNVYTDRKHTAVAGSSSGGIESFYIGMEHADKFGTIGALSPAFGLFSDKTWVKYLKSKDLKKNKPFVYIYNGDGDELEKMLKVGAVSMTDNLKKVGYGKKDYTLKLYSKGLHNEKYWRALFPEFLKLFI
ncbi:MAG: alpha/beta hydrolase [Ruminococcus sp.]|nr:alpha/beta hydrolase [Ruminococcus sp.]